MTISIFHDTFHFISHISVLLTLLFLDVFTLNKLYLKPFFVVICFTSTWLWYINNSNYPSLECHKLPDIFKMYKMK